MVANTAAFARTLRAFLRGPDDNEKLRNELMEFEALGLMPVSQGRTSRRTTELASLTARAVASS